MLRSEICRRAVWSFLAIYFVGGFADQALAVNVLVLSSDSTALDNQIQTVLQNHGHSVTIGDPYYNFFGAGLDGRKVVLLLANFNWATGQADMPLAGQEALVSFVSNGGGLITAEWTAWKWATEKSSNVLFTGSFARLGVLFPVQRINDYGFSNTLTYAQDTPDSILNSGIPPSFAFLVDDIEGTETLLVPELTATVFYSSTGSRFYDNSGPMNGAGLVGWRVGAGHVLQFSTLLGPKELADAMYGRLVANAVNWAGRENRGPLVSKIRFDPAPVRPGESLTAEFLGDRLTANTYFDIRFRAPESTTNEVAFNWQQGTSTRHTTLSETITGNWTVTGVRAHENRDDHSGDFDPVSATLPVGR